MKEIDIIKIILTRKVLVDGQTRNSETKQPRLVENSGKDDQRNLYHQSMRIPQQVMTYNLMDKNWDLMANNKLSMLE